MFKNKPDVFQAIADPTRRAILVMLATQALPVNALAENFEMSRPAVSKHIKVLHESGLVKITDSGRERYCTLNQLGFKEVTNWFAYFDKFWNEKLNNLENFLNQQHKTDKP
ncbi:metalloregulator ArsR/SmtB family transcription factor [Mucilaginibacter sp. PAMB04168]|uniref:ArsR/SmtB family transcription factor n=1 Tax=Mucilaginibacter sp. PAMB04168 TaxID=3138567 RepID=UPI0031F663BA